MFNPMKFQISVCCFRCCLRFLLFRVYRPVPVFCEVHHAAVRSDESREPARHPCLARQIPVDSHFLPFRHKSLPDHRVSAHPFRSRSHPAFLFGAQFRLCGRLGLVPVLHLSACGLSAQFPAAKLLPSPMGHGLSLCRLPGAGRLSLWRLLREPSAARVQLLPDSGSGCGLRVGSGQILANGSCII